MKYIILLVAFFFLDELQADPLVLKENKVVTSFLGKVQYLEDKSSKLEITQILSLKDFLPYDKETINFGTTDSVYWIKIEIINNSQTKDWYLETAAPSIDHLHFYFFKGESLFFARAGDEENPVNARVNPNFTYFPIQVLPGEKGTIFLSLKSHEILELPIQIVSDSNLLQDGYNRDYFQGIYFGIILIMAMYNLFLYFNLKDSAYLYYVFYVLSIGSVSAYFSGYISNKFIIYYSNILSILAGIFSILFSIKILGTKLYSFKINWILLFYILIYIFSLFVELIGLRAFNSGFVYITTATLSFFLMFSGAYIYFKYKYIPARYYFISWFALIVGLNIQFLRAFGVLNYNSFTSHALQIGNVLEILLLSFALADRINQYKKEFEESRERAINALNSNRKLIEEQNKLLEEKVTERTKIIEEQKVQLEIKNKLLLKEIELAGKFQQNLLPNKPQVIPRVQLGFLYQPMLGVGGDFIDILHEKDSSYLGLFICDVTGHGITASLIASMVKISLQGWEKMIDKPSEIPESIRANLKDKLDKHFLTAGICSLNLETLELKYVSAGHPPIVCIRSNEKPEFLSSKGRAIGNFFPTACSELSIQLEKGDKIVLYTDGIVEARNRRGIMLGEETFLAKLEELKSLAPREMAGELSAFMKKYIGGKETEDDMTLLVMEVEY